MSGSVLGNPSAPPPPPLDDDLQAILAAAQATLGSGSTAADRLAVLALQASLLSTQQARAYGQMIAAQHAATVERDEARDARYQRQYADSLSLAAERDARYQAQYQARLELAARQRDEDLDRAAYWRAQDIARQQAHYAAMQAAAEAQLEILRGIPHEPGGGEPPAGDRAALVRALISTMAPAYMKPGTGTTEATQAADARNDAQYLRLAVTEVLAVHEALTATKEPR